MDSSSLVLLLGYFAMLALVVGGFLVLRRKSAAPAPGAPAAAPAAAAPAEQPAAGGRRGRRGLDRLRQRRPGGDENADANAAAAGADEAEADDAAVPMDKKAMEKERKRLEREARRQAEEEAREEKKKREEARAEAKRKKDEEREQRRMEREAEEKRKEEEKRKQEEEVYNEWKDAIVVEEAGSAEQMTEEEMQGQLERFVEYLREHKVSPLDDLAAEFGLKTDAVIERIKALEAEGRVTGVIDDRGKFIFVTPEELDAVAAFINRRGRVSIADVVSESNKLIDLSQ